MRVLDVEALYRSIHIHIRWTFSGFYSSPFFPQQAAGRTQRHFVALTHLLHEVRRSDNTANVWKDETQFRRLRANATHDLCSCIRDHVLYQREYICSRYYPDILRRVSYLHTPPGISMSSWYRTQTFLAWNCEVQPTRPEGMRRRTRV